MAAFHAPASPRNNRRLAHQASQVRGVARPARLYDENSENANFLETLALFRRIGAAATLDADACKIAESRPIMIAE